jgi:hypothetical protein
MPLGPVPTWSSWFLSISSCGRFSSVMLIDCAILGRRTSEEEAGLPSDALAGLCVSLWLRQKATLHHTSL